MAKLNSDGNLMGRALALIVLGASAFGLHKINCGAGSCPLMADKAYCGSKTAAASPAR